MKKAKKEGISYGYVGNQKVRFANYIDDDSPWLLTNPRKERMCSIWQAIHFNMYGVVPSSCYHHCYKNVIVSRQRTNCTTIEQLRFSDIMELYDLQNSMQHPSKVGMDTRDYTPSIWGAYWYHDKLRHAKEMEVTLQGEYPEYEVFTKKSCTEMEMFLGNVREWEKRECRPQIMLDREIEIDAWLFTEHLPAIDHTQPELHRRELIIKWMYWAHKHGDFSYRQFMEDDDRLVFNFGTKQVEYEKPWRI